MPANGMRPRIDFFHHRITGSSEFPDQYPAMNFNQMRPPSRHKELPQNLELPPNEHEDDLPSLDEDFDSLEEFEIGIENASAKRPSKKSTALSEKRVPLIQTLQPDLGTQGLNDDSSGEDDEAIVQETEIVVADNPTLQDFLNLSNGGGRFLKAT